MAARNHANAAAGGVKIRIKAPKRPGLAGNSEGEQDVSNGSRASPLSSLRDADTSQYLERVVDALNLRWSELTRNEPSPWRSPTLSPAAWAVQPSPKRSPLPPLTQSHAPSHPPPLFPALNSSSQHGHQPSEQPPLRRASELASSMARQWPAPQSSPSEEGEMPEGQLGSGSKRQSPSVGNRHQRSDKVQRRSLQASSPHHSPHHAVPQSPSQDIEPQHLPKIHHPSPPAAHTAQQPPLPPSPAANHDVRSKGNEREQTTLRHSRPESRHTAPTGSPKKSIEPAQPVERQGGDARQQRQQANGKIRPENHPRDKVPSSYNNHSPERDGHDEREGSRGTRVGDGERVPTHQGRHEALDQDSEFAPQMKRRRQSVDDKPGLGPATSRGIATAPAPTAEPPRMVDVRLSPLSPHVIEPEDVVPEMVDTGVQAAEEYRDMECQTSQDPLSAWALSHDSEDAGTFLSVNRKKLHNTPAEHPLQGKVMEYNTTTRRDTKERLLTFLRDHGHKNYQKARELKHAAEKQPRGKDSRWSIESVCTFVQAAVGFLECQELMALTRKDAASGNEFVNVASLFGLAASYASRAERGESSGLARMALQVLSQRMQAVALMRFVYYSSKHLKQDYDAVKASAGMDVGNGLSPDDSTTSSQEVHSTETPTRPSARSKNVPDLVANGGPKPNAPRPSQNSMKRMMDAANSMVKSIDLLTRTASSCQDLASQASNQLNEDMKLLPVLLGALGTDAGMSPHGLRVVQAARHALDMIKALVKPKTS